MMSRPEDNSQNLIEGIGDEVLLSSGLLTAFVLVVALILYRLFGYRAHGVLIHPSNQDAVNSTRQQLGARFRSNRLQGSPNQENGTDANVNGHPPTVTASSSHYGMDNQCPICLNEPRLPIETNCGHLFCAQCLIVYWRHGNWRGPGPGPVRCPVCRQQVTVMLTCFRIDATPGSEEETQERQQVLHDINDYNRRFSGEPRPWLDYLRDLPTLLRHISAEFFTVGGLMYMLRIRIVLCFVAAIMYLISPLDMIPEAIFGLLGLLDDTFVVLLLAIYVTIIYRRFLANRWEEETL